MPATSGPAHAHAPAHLGPVPRTGRTPLTNFVGHHGYQFWDRVVLDERVEQANSFVAAEASEKARTGKDYVENKVRENPLAAVGIAFGTGVLLAALRRK